MLGGGVKVATVRDTGVRLMLGACPRCGGALSKEHDAKTFGNVWYCLNCGAAQYGDGRSQYAATDVPGGIRKTA